MFKNSFRLADISAPGVLAGAGKGETMLTLADIKNMKKDVITPKEAAQVLGCDPQWIRLVAHRQPERLPFPALAVRSRTKIPRLPFIKFMEGETQ